MASAQNSPKVAIVHDWIYGGGAEKVVEAIHHIYPEAPIYTSYCTPEWRTRLDNKVITGYLNKWPFTKLRKFLPLLRQWWFAGLDLSEYDIVISSTGNGEAKFIKTRPDAIHICYCHSPVHFYWRKYNDYIKNPGFGKLNFLARIGLKFFVKPLRQRDYQASQKVDYFIANSTHIQNDIKEFYDRESQVIHPPINTNLFKSAQPKSLNKLSFIIWGRHVPDKRIDLAIKACNELNIPLTIVGKGPITEELKKIAGDSITFTGFIDDNELIKQAENASAFLFPSLEDFGIAPVEAMSTGLPVIAYRGGGALDFISPGVTGEFFDEQSVNSLKDAISNFEPTNYKPDEIKNRANEFSTEKFNSELIAFVDKSQKSKS